MVIHGIFGADYASLNQYGLMTNDRTMANVMLKEEVTALFKALAFELGTEC
jgi:hypothetical protein